MKVHQELIGLIVFYEISILDYVPGISDLETFIVRNLYTSSVDFKNLTSNHIIKTIEKNASESRRNWML